MSSSLKIALGVVVAIVLLALLRFQPWHHAQTTADNTVHSGPNAAAR